MPTELKMYDEYGRPRSPLDKISGLKPVSEEFVQKMLERHERVILPEILRRERERLEGAHRMRIGCGSEPVLKQSRARSARDFVFLVYTDHMKWFWEKDESKMLDDPVLEEQAEQTIVGREHDREAIRANLLRQYETPQSAIEDYCSGYLTDEQLEIRFSPEEVAFIREQKEDRDDDYLEVSSGGYL